MQIGDLAVRTGIPAKTLRYYEELGLLDPSRTSSGWRDYGENDPLVLELTAIGKRLGLKLRQITGLVDQFRDPSISNAALTRAMEPHKARIHRGIDALTAALELLESLTRDCPLRRCPD